MLAANAVSTTTYHENEQPQANRDNALEAQSPRRHANPFSLPQSADYCRASTEAADFGHP